MRLAQKFAGYSLADADSLRKAAGKKIREIMAKEREKFVDGCVSAGYGEDARHQMVRHHRAVRRLRFQQIPLLWLRLRRLPDRLPQGELPGRVHVGVAHQRQVQPRQGRGVPRRVPGHGHPRHRRRCQPVVDELRARDPRRRLLRDHLRALGGARRRHRSGGAHHQRARRQRPLRRLLRLLRAGRHRGAEQEDDRGPDQGGGLRLRRPPAPGPAHRVRVHHRPHRRRAGRNPTPAS